MIMLMTMQPIGVAVGELEVGAATPRVGQSNFLGQSLKFPDSSAALQQQPRKRDD